VHEAYQVFAGTVIRLVVTVTGQDALTRASAQACENGGVGARRWLVGGVREAA
jgi:hypothetical protein